VSIYFPHSRYLGLFVVAWSIRQPCCAEAQDHAGPPSHFGRDIGARTSKVETDFLQVLSIGAYQFGPPWAEALGILMVTSLPRSLHLPSGSFRNLTFSTCHAISA